MAINPWTSHNKESDELKKRRREEESDSSSKETRDASSESRSYADQFHASGNVAYEGKGEGAIGTGEGSFRDKYLHKNAEKAGSGEEDTAEDKKTVAAEESGTATHAEKVSGELLRKLEEKRRAASQDDLPALSKNAQKQLNGSFRELSLIEGNLRGIDHDLRAIYCTSCFEKEGKTTVSASTAFGLAEFGSSKVLLIDSNCETPQMHRLFGVSESPGLSDVLGGAKGPEEVIIPTSYERLYLLPAGEKTGSFGSDEFEQFIKTCKDNFDFVIVDGKTLFSTSEVPNMATLVDGFLVVVACERTKWEVVQLAQEKLKKAGSQHAGVVLNKRRYYLPKLVYRLISRS